MNTSISISKIIRSSRKTLSLEVREGQVVVRAPKRMPKADIDDIVRRKQNWLIKHVNKQRERQTSLRQFKTGEVICYLGKAYPLKLLDTMTEPFQFSDEQFLLHVDYHSQANIIFEAWYRDQARHYFSERAEFYAKLMGLSFNKLRISGAKTRWGSCSSRRNLNFTWRLMMAPPEVIDYVVVHELCHLHEMNHSRRFWSHVEKWSPDYKAHCHWLKINGSTLDLEAMRKENGILVNEIGT